MTDNDKDQGPEDVSGERTSAFRADFTNEQDAAATAGAEGRLLGAEALPPGSALLVVKAPERRHTASLTRNTIHLSSHSFPTHRPIASGSRSLGHY